MFIAGRVFGIFALTLAFACSGAFAISQSDRDVQTLGNFLVLQKIASKDGATLRDFVKRVSAIYVKAGYNDFGPEFRRSGGAVLAQFAIGAGDDDLKKARSALRKLEQALEKDAFVVLPASAGKSLPDYFGLAHAFLEGAKVGLKNVALGKNVANALRNNKGFLWVTKINNDTFTGSLTGTFTFDGATSSNNGTLMLSGPGATFNGSITIAAAQDTLLVGGVITGDGSFTKIGTGTLILTGSSTYDGAININNGSVQVASLTPLANSTIELNGGNLTITGTTGAHWVDFPPAIEIPVEFNGKFHIHLKKPYTLNGADLPTGSAIYPVNNDYVAPDDAITLSGTDLSATLTPPPTPTPTP